MSKKLHTARSIAHYSGGMNHAPAPISPGTLNAEIPIIGVSGPEALSYGTAAIVAQLKAQGAYPIILEHDTSKVQDYLGMLDGLVVLGNRYDIDPKDYGQEKHPKSIVPDTEEYTRRMRFESAMVEAALASKMPLLGICGGMQRLNVGGGKAEQGTLIQHVPSDPIKHDHVAWPYTPVQCIKLLEGTRLRALAQGAKGYFAPIHVELPEHIILENSIHHQAVGVLRKGFQPAAIAADGVVEAIEPAPGGHYDGQWVLGLQWHPEFGTSPVSQRIIEAFAQATKEYDRGHAHRHDLTQIMPSAIITLVAQGKGAIARLFDGVEPLTQQR